MEFSDDSFIWANASNDSDTMEYDIKEEDSDNTPKINNRKESQGDFLEHKKKSKKRKHEELNEDNESVDHKPHKYIKCETDSDFETPKKKKKKKNSHHNEEQLESVSYDNILNFKVKEEVTSFVEPAPIKSKKQKKKRKQSESLTSDNLEDTTHDIITNGTSDSLEIDDNSNINEVVERKKKKKSKRKTSETITLPDDIQNSDDSYHKKKKKKKKRETEIHSESFDIKEDSQNEEISCINGSAFNNNFVEDDQFKEKSSDDMNKQSRISEQETNNLDASNAKPPQKTSKILDRLRFEDDDSLDSEPKENDDDTKLSKNLRKFFDTNKNLLIIPPKALTNAQASMITDDDDIWIINTPHELNVEDFVGKKIKVDGKSKVKLNGKSYDTVIDNSIKKTPILSHIQNKIFIRNVPIINSIKVRKRIPKTHIPEENVTINDQTNFIPLPETKCRHPLFGINYRESIEILPSINERLNNTVTESLNNDKVKRKKHRKEKRKIEIETEFETSQKLEMSQTEALPVVSPKKKRKRNSSVKDECVVKKAKYIKNEPESTNVWDSEQAIEKNLFDF